MHLWEVVEYQVNDKTLQTKQVLDNIGHGGISFWTSDTAIFMQSSIKYKSVLHI